MDETSVKKCSRCRKELPLSAFYRNRANRDGSHSACAHCMKTGVPVRTLEQKFWERIDKSGPVPKHTPGLGPCWVWIAGKDSFGYGRVNIGGRKERPRGAHVVSWVIAHGGAWPALCVLHKCDNPACVNPDHLFLGTRLDNNNDKIAKGRNGFAIQLGEIHGMAKITESDVREMRRLRSLGMLQRHIGDRFGITQTNVSLIVRKKTWSHVI